MQTRIRKGTPQDIPQVLNLIKELALFEKAPEQVITNVEQMIKDGFGDNPCYKLLIAESLTPNPSPPQKTGQAKERGEIVGMAVYFIKYSTWKGKGIYLDDIVVSENMRGKGIGKKLFDEVINECKVNGCKQLHWQVLDWNIPAINFYKKYSAEFDAGWINCKLHFGTDNE